MRKLGKKQLTLELHEPLADLPAGLMDYPIVLSADGRELTYTYDTRAQRTGITTLLSQLSESGIRFRDLRTSQSSLEEIFVDLLRQSR
jgi:ABC-2 type transport system ATP-binding protein